MSGSLPDAVLFTCTANSVRSPMAEALMKVLYGSQIYVASCGVTPKTEPDPFAVNVIDEVGGDMADHRPRGFDDLDDTSFDLIISLTPEAHHRAGEMARGCAVDRLYWPTLDPTLNAGSREGMLESYRATRDELKARILQRFGPSMSVGG